MSIYIENQSFVVGMQWKSTSKVNCPHKHKIGCYKCKQMSSRTGIRPLQLERSQGESLIAAICRNWVWYIGRKLNSSKGSSPS